MPDAGWSSLAARRAHNPKVTGSNPVPATNKALWFIPGGFLLLVVYLERTLACAFRVYVILRFPCSLEPVVQPLHPV